MNDSNGYINGNTNTNGNYHPVSEEDIQRLAYELWEEAGCPEGRSQEFWQQAELALRGPTEEGQAAWEKIPKFGHPA